jgi:trehalose synthase
MASPFSAYRPLIGETEHDLLHHVAGTLRGLRVSMVNSTRDGGGVAEILRNMIPLINELGVQMTWEIMEGTRPFFEVTKALHNALHGKQEPLTPAMEQIYWETTGFNSRRLSLLREQDLVFIHDPQPAGLIRQLQRENQPWIFRCHVDVSSPFPPVWAFVSGMLRGYDASVFSHPSFAQQLGHPQFLIAPSIDPLADKNKALPEAFIQKTLLRFGLDPSRPLVTQVSRFDKLKDPLGVIQAYRLLKKTHPDVQLLLAGGTASDDPESSLILPSLLAAALEDPDVHILDLPPFSDLEINALQRGSTVILQKSLREGFALTVTEALWKEKPVVAMAVGGIPQQVLHGKTGWLVHSVEGTAYYLRRILDNPLEAAALGRQGKEHVRRNFLITRHILEYLSLFHCVLNPGQSRLQLS